MASKGAKKNASSNRVSSATPREAASIAQSATDSKRPRLVIWPEWSDADVNAEKWDTTHKGKEKDKGKSPVVQHSFDDPEGKIEMPPTMKVDHWKRPQDYITEKTPTVVDADGMNTFDLITKNEHLHESELMRYIISQIMALWEMSSVKPLPPDQVQTDPASPLDEMSHTWRPWEHIYAMNKVQKGPHVPPYNPYGKYVVKLYWMGLWRKIIIDDSLPFDENDRLMLPCTTMQHEVWPMLLTKALIKVASLDYTGGSQSCEFGDFSVVNCLTSWLPEAIPLQYGHINEVWNLLKNVLPEWKLPLQEWEKALIEEENKKKEETQSPIDKEEKSDKDTASKDGKPPEKQEAKPAGKDAGKEKGGKDGKDKEKGKDGKDKKGDKDKDKKGGDKEKVTEEPPIPEHPEVVIFASYRSTPKYPVKVSVLGENADASERLRQNGLSHLYPHPVLITQTRACPLEPPPPPEKIPAWKLIRPRKKKTTPSSEEGQGEPEPPRPIQCLEITSPFVNYKVSPVPIPTDTHRPKSALERGSTRSRPGSSVGQAIEETDENAPEPEEEPVKKEEPVEESSPKLERKLSRSASRSDKGSAKKPGSREGEREKEKPKEAKSVSQPGTPQTLQVEPGVGDHAGGLAVPPDPTAEGTDQEVEAPKEGEEVVDVAPKPKKLWIDFEQFCKCFKTLYIYHKHNTYSCYARHSDLKDFRLQQGYDDKAPLYLSVDSLQPTEIVVSFSSLSRWPEPPPPPVEEKKSHTSTKGGKDKIDEKEITHITSSSLLEGSVGHEPAPPPVVTPGTLVAEPYSWKSLVTGQPILRLRTTALRAAVLCLPAGRHVLKFMMSGPLGYHVHLCSSTKFEFGDEETVMSQLTKESCRFVDNANQVISGIGKCISSFGDTEEFKKAWKDLTAAHCPYQFDKQMSKQHHFQIFSQALYTTLRKVLKEIASPEIAFAWRAFMFDATSKNILGIPAGSRPATGQTSHRGSAKHAPAPAGKVKQQQSQPDGEAEKVDTNWTNRQATTEEHVAMVKIQKQWKGYWVRKIKAARMQGTEENAKVQQNLQKSWIEIEKQLDITNPEHPGLFMFRQMFKLDPDMMMKFPFYQDEWNKISYNDYKGQFPDQQPNNWFLVFREVFHVSEEMLAVPKLYVPINTCMLRVINNDTGEELPRVFQKVAPYVYKKNRKGYTFVAEARTTDNPLQTGVWRMRMIGSLSPLPAPLRNEVNSSFSVKEIRDYYVPNPKNIVFRYGVKVTEDHLTSIQMNTSKTDVYIKLSVLNNEEEVASTIGKGHSVIPAFQFLKDVNAEEEVKRSSSRALNESTNKGDSKDRGKKVKRGGSGKSNDGRGSQSPHAKPRRRKRSSQQSDGGLSDGDLEDKNLKPHKYIIQAEVLKDSWPLSEASWAFVQMLKELEKNELKVAFKEKQADEPPKTEKAPAAADKGKGAKGGKGAKDKGGKDKDGKGSRPPSQQFDIGKPHWTLRVVSDASCSDEIEVKKDTERADEIRALKKAWEDAEPGRAAKAMQSRLKYLSTHTIKLKDDEEGKEEGEKGEGEGEVALDLPATTPGSYLDQLDEGNLTLEPPPPPTPKEMLQPIDITPFIKRGSGPPRYLDEEEYQRKLEEQQRQIAEYKQFRQGVEQWREQDKQLRNMTKEKQLQECEELQAMLDAARDSVNKPREAFRQKYLEAERKRLEEMEAQEAKMKADLEAKSPKGKKNSAKGKKSPSAKKKK